MGVVHPNRATAPISVRRFAAADAPATYRIFFDAVHYGTGAAYSVAERIAWANSDRMPATWTQRLAGQHSLVAGIEGRLLGFMAMDEFGLVDMAYVHPSTTRQGIARKLHEALEAEARQQGLTKLTTEASLIAQHFFTAMGWREVSRHKRLINGVALRNVRMEKPL